MSDLKITGKIAEINPTQTFESGAQKVEFIVKNDDGYEGAEKIYAFEMFAGASKLEKIEKFLKFNKIGQEVDVKFNVDCREYKGRYYTNLSAWSVFGAQSDSVEDSAFTGESEVLDEEPPF